MLVSISVAALLVSLVYGAVRIGQRSADALNGQVEAGEVMRIGWQYLHGALTRARPVPDPTRSEGRTGFQGDAEQLSFVADMPAYVGLGGLVRIRLGAADNDTGTQLILSRERFDPQAGTAADESLETAVLVEELDRLGLAYFGQQGPDETPAWHTRWDDQNTLPNLVRIDIRPAGERAWPLLIARPLTGAVPLPEDAESFLQAEAAIE
jgi:general secretion pathway protein J